MTYEELQASPGIVVVTVGPGGDLGHGPRSGDTVVFKNAQGQSFVTNMLSDGTLKDPVPESDAPQRANDAAARAVENQQRTQDNQDYTRTRQSNQDQATAIAKARKQSSDFTAAVAASIKVHNNGGQLSEGELQALAAGPGTMPGGASGAGQSGGAAKYSFPLDNYQGPIAPHWAGNPTGAVDLQAGPGDVVHAITDGTIQMSDPHYGSAGATVVIKGDDGRTYMYQDMDPASLPKQGGRVTSGQAIGFPAGPNVPSDVHTSGPHLHVAISENGMPGFETGAGTATGFNTLDALKQIQGGGFTGTTTGAGGMPGGGLTAEQIAGLSGGPAAKSGTVHPIDNQLWYVGPNGENPHVIATGPPSAPTHLNYKSGGQDIVMNWDPTANGGKGQWTQVAVGQPDLSETPMGKIQSTLSQADTSQKMVQAAYKAGTITYDQMTAYTQHLNDYVDSALQGTTPFERQKFQQEQNTIKQQTAKDLLDTSVTQTTKAASDLIGQSMSLLGSKDYSAMHLAPDTLYNIYAGGLGVAQQNAKPLTDFARQLLASVSTTALSNGIDPRTNVITGQAPPSSLPTPPPGVQPLGLGAADETLSQPQPALA